MSNNENSKLLHFISSNTKSKKLVSIDVKVFKTQGWRGHWAFYYTGPQSFIIMFSYSLA